MKIAAVILWIIAILLGCGIGVLVLATQGSRNTMHNDQQSVAVVTGNVKHAYYGNYNEQGIQYFYCAQIQFQTRDGQTVSVTQSDATQFRCDANVSSSPDHPVGQQIPVYYDPHDPAHTVRFVSDVKTSLIVAQVAGGLALFFLIVCLAGGTSMFVAGLAREKRGSR